MNHDFLDDGLLQIAVVSVLVLHLMQELRELHGVLPGFELLQLDAQVEGALVWLKMLLALAAGCL